MENGVMENGELIMKLYIDTSSAKKITIKIDGERFDTEARKEKSQKLLPFIAETLESMDKNIKDLKEIEVNTGPGSFTGLRVGVSVAQTIGWVLGIPVNGKKINEGEKIEINYE